MAEYLDVSRNTVSAWINGRTPPNTQSIRLWALRTGVAYDWLRTGKEGRFPPPPQPPGNPFDPTKEPVDELVAA